MIRSQSQSRVNIVLMVFGGLLLLEGAIAHARHEPSLHFWGAASKWQSWEVMFMGTFCFLVGLTGFVNPRKRSRKGPGQRPWFDHLV
jgi:hypothetical protein